MHNDVYWATYDSWAVDDAACMQASHLINNAMLTIKHSPYFACVGINQ
jgi:hypothetical protein